MPVIQLTTKIKADITTVFNLARSVKLHELSTAKTHEKAIAGKTSGLMELGDEVTWRAKHLGFYQTLSSKITKYEEPYFFEDVMQQGIFSKLEHEHYFKQENEMVIMTDVFKYESLFGILGKLADVLFLKRYMARFLKQRNKTVKHVAETNRDKELLNS